MLISKTIQLIQMTIFSYLFLKTKEYEKSIWMTSIQIENKWFDIELSI